ncbi:hypothetical protein D3C72_2102210 [compost metagenome]
MEGALGPGLEHQREQAAIGAEIALPQGVAGVGFKRWVQQPLHLGLIGQPPRHAQSGCALGFEPQLEGLQSAQHEETVVRAHLLAEDALRLAQHVVVRMVVHADAAH